MQRLWSSSILRSRYVLAVLSGLTLAAAFPRLGIAGLAWIAPGFMVAAAWGKRGWESFRIGYVAGLAHYLAMLYWLLLIPYRWHGVPLGPAAGWLSLSAYLALFPATWVWLVSGVQSPKSKVQSRAAVQSLKSEVQSQGPEVEGQGAGEEEWRGSWVGRTWWAVSGAVLWVALEMVLARALGGFPWDLLGVSQYQLVPLIQMASVTGVYGVGFVIVWFSLSLVSSGVMLLRRPALRSVWVTELCLPILTVAALFSCGFRHMHHELPAARALKLKLIQPSIPQTVIWDPTGDDERFGEILRLSEQALSNRTDLLIWPEAAIPKLLRWNRDTFEAVAGLASRHHVWLIVGADDMERPEGSRNLEDATFYNSSFLISPEGKLIDYYRKRSLVIFGEYIPLQKWLPFLKWFTPIQGGFGEGKGPVPFVLSDLGVKTSVLICFEDVFAQIGRDSVAPDTDFLVNITNDGWFGEAAAQWQQAATSVFRTVENGVPLVRCTNTGLTCWIDACGRIRETFRDQRGSVYGAGFLSFELLLPGAGEHHAQTFYNRYGDVFGWACVGLAGAMVLLKWVGWRKRSRQP